MKEAHHFRLQRELPAPEMKETFPVSDMEEYSTNHPRNKGNPPRSCDKEERYERNPLYSLLLDTTLAIPLKQARNMLSLKI